MRARTAKVSPSITRTTSAGIGPGNAPSREDADNNPASMTTPHIHAGPTVRMTTPIHEAMLHAAVVCQFYEQIKNMDRFRGFFEVYSRLGPGFASLSQANVRSTFPSVSVPYGGRRLRNR
ncbi:MAG: hypothetical protein ACREER_01270 [Alphaproteobacteria bacterium]